MKKTFLSILFIVFAVQFTFSQKVIEKRVETEGKSAELNFSFADNIKVNAWDKNYIDVRVEVNIDDNKYNDYYSLEIDDSKGIKIVEEIDFDEIQEIRGDKNNCNFNADINYSLQIPKDLKISLETISGKVELKGCQGEMAINSVSGFIDYSVPQNHDAKIDLSTVTGDVYTNLKFDPSEKKDISWVGTNRQLSLNGGDIPVNLKTVSGDIFLRKN